MSVVQNIFKLKSENKFTTEDLVKFKDGGRPKPKMAIKQTSSKVNRYFRDSMYNLSEWICGCEVRNAFFCFPCLLFGNEDPVWCKIGVTDLKHLKIKVHKHSLSSAHMSSCCNLATLGKVDIKLQLDSAYRKTVKTYNENVFKNRYILNKIIDCVLFCGIFVLEESESSDNPGTFQGLINFISELDVIFKEHLENSTVFKGAWNVIQNELLDSMLVVIHEEIKSEINQTDFIALQVDEITDGSNKTQLIFIFRYILNGVLSERFWKFVKPRGTSSQHLTEVILKELECLKINECPQKLVAQSYDRAAVKSGIFGGVQTKIKKYYPSANFIHCYAHRLNLILQKVASQDRGVRIFFANLHSFSLFFEKSPRRIAVLDEVVKTVPVCWNFDTECVETVYTYQTELVECLGQIIRSETRNDTISQAVSLKKCLGSEDFLYWLNFFRLVLPHCDVLSSQLQKRDLDIVTVNKCIINFNTNIEKIRNKILNNYVDKPPREHEKSKTGVSKRRISLEICDMIMAEVKQRFGFNSHLIVLQLFHADRFKDYKKAFPQDIYKLVKTEYPAVSYVKLKTELEVLYGTEDFYNSEGALAMLRMFFNNNLSVTFSESVKLLQILCTLPMPTAESERCFSTLRRSVAFLRNTMGQGRLSDLAVLSIEKLFIRNIKDFNEKVIDHFASQKDRMIDLLYKSF
ncbi:zinc finger MYM-type protein 1 isoform X1 [Anoplophora glabripennis]|uniref:zinc finger MYM-type protein 1 isoform X1 n=1 Tax=Anoplophora glabripennis TaxID=217634 RepID=UPI0008740FEC|nr:zinc finger MYM-type protein 1 isoform X1 [Anoplophora glabripennis]